MCDFYTELNKISPEGSLHRDEPMSAHTSFRAGGTADYYLQVQDENQLKNGLMLAQEYDLPACVLGRGSNVLVSDSGFHGAIFCLDQSYAGVSLDRELDDGTYLVTAQAGTRMSSLSQFLVNHSLTGFEWGAGIPGTVGGAVYMNAGAYGGEMSHVIQSAVIMDKDFQEKRPDVKDLDLSYRHSRLMDQGGIVLSVTMGFRKGDPVVISDRIQELAEKRREKQPLNYPSAGSAFKRPEGYFAGKLIQDAGLSGYTVGGAQVSEKHCGFVINKGDATAGDIYRLTEDVRKVVKDKFSVDLQREFRLIGQFPC